MAKKKNNVVFGKKSTFWGLIIIATLLVGLLIALKITQTRTLLLSRAADPTVPCLAYAVQDAGADDTQFFGIDLFNKTVSDIGGLQTNRNLEGLDFHPQTEELYAITGRSDVDPATLYKVDPRTGVTTLVGSTGLNVGSPNLSFRPTDNTLWSWADRKGLYSIDVNTGKATLVHQDTNQYVIGLAWSLDGNTLYYTVDTNLYAMNFSTKKSTLVASNLLPIKIEGLEMRPDGLLMIAYHKNPNLTIYAYDVNAKQFVQDEAVLTEYGDIEGIAWPDNCYINPPEPTPTPSPEPVACPDPITFEADQVDIAEKGDLDTQYMDSHGVEFKLYGNRRSPIVAYQGDPLYAFVPHDTVQPLYTDIIGQRFATDRRGQRHNAGRESVIYPFVMYFRNPDFQSNEVHFDIIDAQERETYNIQAFRDGSTAVAKVVYKGPAGSPKDGGGVLHFSIRSNDGGIIKRIVIRVSKPESLGSVGWGIDNIDACQARYQKDYSGGID